VKLSENERAHFECRLAQAEDADMKVEWFKDNELLPQGKLFHLNCKQHLFIVSQLACVS